ncbi:MAG: UDP-N-acetylglucosamine 2-epimerase [bacterium]|nr:UDP-N-acetylglucosamine 2-epimerase [bacterium]
MRRKICVFSGKRGGFGAYLNLMRLIENDPDLELQIILSDMHASDKFGATAKEVKGFFPNVDMEVVPMNSSSSDSPVARATNLGACLEGLAPALERLKPNILMVHGDRGEHLMAAFAALNLGIPVTHTQGGETSGNIDDVQRHAITKLAHLHFPETEKAAQKIRALGEDDWRIRVVGSLYIDRIVGKQYSDVGEMKKRYDAPGEYVLVLYHPDTFLTPAENRQVMTDILVAVMHVWRIRTIVVHPCSDPGHEEVISTINAAKKEDVFDHLRVYKNIDNLDFLGLMAGASALIGNSSAALVEAPYFHLPAVNVGDRQRGRDHELNIINSATEINSIVNAVGKAINPSGDLRDILKSCGQRLGDGHASEKIFAALKAVEINEKLLRKS